MCSIPFNGIHVLLVYSMFPSPNVIGQAAAETVIYRNNLCKDQLATMNEIFTSET